MLPIKRSAQNIAQLYQISITRTASMSTENTDDTPDDRVAKFYFSPKNAQLILEAVQKKTRKKFQVEIGSKFNNVLFHCMKFIYDKRPRLHAAESEVTYTLQLNNTVVHNMVHYFSENLNQNQSDSSTTNIPALLPPNQIQHYPQSPQPSLDEKRMVINNYQALLQDRQATATQVAQQVTPTYVHQVDQPAFASSPLIADNNYGTINTTIGVAQNAVGAGHRPVEFIIPRPEQRELPTEHVSSEDNDTMEKYVSEQERRESELLQPSVDVLPPTFNAGLSLSEPKLWIPPNTQGTVQLRQPSFEPTPLPTIPIKVHPTHNHSKLDTIVEDDDEGQEGEATWSDFEAFQDIYETFNDAPVPSTAPSPVLPQDARQQPATQLQWSQNTVRTPAQVLPSHTAPPNLSSAELCAQIASVTSKMSSLFESQSNVAATQNRSMLDVLRQQTDVMHAHTNLLQSQLTALKEYTSLTHTHTQAIKDTLDGTHQHIINLMSAVSDAAQQAAVHHAELLCSIAKSSKSTSVKKKFVNSSDRDVDVWPGTNEFQIDVSNHVGSDSTTCMIHSLILPNQIHRIIKVIINGEEYAIEVLTGIQNLATISNICSLVDGRIHVKLTDVLGGDLKLPADNMNIMSIAHGHRCIIIEVNDQVSMIDQELVLIKHFICDFPPLTEFLNRSIGHKAFVMDTRRFQVSMPDELLKPCTYKTFGKAFFIRQTVGLLLSSRRTYGVASFTEAIAKRRDA